MCRGRAGRQAGRQAVIVAASPALLLTQSSPTRRRRAASPLENFGVADEVGKPGIGLKALAIVRTV